MSKTLQLGTTLGELITAISYNKFILIYSFEFKDTTSLALYSYVTHFSVTPSKTLIIVVNTTIIPSIIIIVIATTSSKRLATRVIIPYY